MGRPLGCSDHFEKMISGWAEQQRWCTWTARQPAEMGDFPNQPCVMKGYWGEFFPTIRKQPFICCCPRFQVGFYIFEHQNKLFIFTRNAQPWWAELLVTFHGIFFAVELLDLLFSGLLNGTWHLLGLSKRPWNWGSLPANEVFLFSGAVPGIWYVYIYICMYIYMNIYIYIHIYIYIYIQI